MGDINEEWEIEEEGSSYGEATKSRSSWIMDTGLNIGKKIVITGVVISSAPLVLPPLVVISALGFAFSLPSGILLSSYVCTEKLMSKLLPIADEEYYYWQKDFKNNEGQDNLEDEKENGSAMEYDYAEKDFGKHLETRGIEEEPLTKRAKVEQPSDHHGVSVTEEEIPMENKGVEKKIYGEIFPTFETDIKENIQETQNEKKIDPHTREATQEEKVQRKGRSVEGNGDEKDVGNTVVAEKTIVNGNETSKKSAKKRTGNKKQDAGAGDEEVQKKKEDEKVVHSAKDTTNTTTSQDTAELPSSVAVPEPKQAAATIPTGKEVRLGEERVREKLDALREILGYKSSSPYRTYLEELRALYIFTGVEPPAVLKDSSDLVEVNDMLEKLMSIVGVK